MWLSERILIYSIILVVLDLSLSVSSLIIDLYKTILYSAWDYTEFTDQCGKHGYKDKVLSSYQHELSIYYLVYFKFISANSFGTPTNYFVGLCKVYAKVFNCVQT